MKVLSNIGTLVTCAAAESLSSTIDGAAIAWEGDEIVWVGRGAEVPTRFGSWPVLDAGGALVVPGLVDCHTHLAFGGWRADEFEQRSKGTDYLEIARAGGGILKTVRQTRAAPEDELLIHAQSCLAEMSALGVTTVECKSGYGLSVHDELKLLRVYKRLAATTPLRIVPTFLGAHVVAPEFRQDPNAYVELLVGEMIPRVAEEGLAEFCDVFVEEGAFDQRQARQILEAGRAHGLEPKLHVDQLGDGGGAALAADLGAVSADHLEYASPAGIDRMAEAGVVPVALPLASLYLRQQPLDGRVYLNRGLPLAVATDFNPGTAPTYHIHLAMMLACNMNRLTPMQALEAATINAAQAVRRAADIGSLEPGKKADFVLVDAPDVNHWLYHFRPNPVRATYVGGVSVYDGPRSPNA